MARKPRGRAINGILILDKPAGVTSNRALQQVKRLFNAAKAGHSGSLDPFATGVLPICLGEATKFTQFLLDADKGYRCTVRFGVATATGDIDGDVTARVDASGLTAETVEAALDAFRGDILQVPSMYSALKHQGKPLYELARAGVEVERKARPVTIHELAMLAFRPGVEAEADFTIRCTKGTYVRTIAEDLGAALGCGAHVTVLRRSLAYPFTLGQAITMEQLQTLRDAEDFAGLDALLLPMDTAAGDLAEVELTTDMAWYLRNGQPVMAPQIYRCAAEGDIVRIFTEEREFLGVGEVLDDGRVAPRRLVVN